MKDIPTVHGLTHCLFPLQLRFSQHTCKLLPTVPKGLASRHENFFCCVSLPLSSWPNAHHLANFRIFVSFCITLTKYPWPPRKLQNKIFRGCVRNRGGLGFTYLRWLTVTTVVLTYSLAYHYASFNCYISSHYSALLQPSPLLIVHKIVIESTLFPEKYMWVFPDSECDTYYCISPWKKLCQGNYAIVMQKRIKDGT